MDHEHEIVAKCSSCKVYKGNILSHATETAQVTAHFFCVVSRNLSSPLYNKTERGAFSYKH